MSDKTEQGKEIPDNPPAFPEPSVPVAIALALDRYSNNAIARYNEKKTVYAEGCMDAWCEAWALVHGHLTTDELRVYMQLRDADAMLRARKAVR